MENYNVWQCWIGKTVLYGPPPIAAIRYNVYFIIRPLTRLAYAFRCYYYYYFFYYCKRAVYILLLFPLLLKTHRAPKRARFRDIIPEKEIGS